MLGILTLLFTVLMFLTAAKVATIVLVGTGMASESARFQARSALMGVGFTTSEAEDVIAHPVRRKLILWLMTFGNAGIVTGITSLLLSFIGAEAGQSLQRIGVLVGGVVVLAFLAASKGIERGLNRATHWALRRWTTLDARDYAALLRFAHDYTVAELYADPEDWLADRPLAELGLPAEGVVLLGVHRHRGDFIGVPTGHTVISPGDTVIAYGRLDHLDALDHRRKGRKGDLAHAEAVSEFSRVREQAG